MPSYKVMTLLKHDGKTYEPGDSIELTPKQAKAMPWAVEKEKKKPAEEEKPNAEEKEQEKPPKEKKPTAGDEEKAKAAKKPEGPKK